MTWQVVTLIGLFFTLAVASRAISVWEAVRRYQSDNWREAQKDMLAGSIGQGRQMDTIIARLTGQDPPAPPE